MAPWLVEYPTFAPSSHPRTSMNSVTVRLTLATVALALIVGAVGMDAQG